MSYRRRDHLFFFHGYALAVGGVVERNGSRQTIDGVAPSVLSIAGGSSHSRTTGFKYPARELETFVGADGKTKEEFFVTFDYAESETYGYEINCEYRTVARSLILGLNINNVVRADVVEGVLESVHPVRAGNGEEHAHIRTRTDARESRIEGLTIRGASVQTTRLAALDDFATFEALDDVLNNAKETVGPDDEKRRMVKRALCDTSLLEPPDADDEPYVQDLCNFKRRDLIRCSILGKVDAPEDHPGVKRRGYSFRIDDFGRLFLGELLVSRDSKRLSMLRFDLGCDETGGGTIGAPAVNGSSMP